MSNITLTPTSGASGVSEVSIVVPSNDTYQEIIASYVITNGESAVNFKLKQKAAVSQTKFIQLSGPLSIPASGGRVTCTVTTNDDWFWNMPEWLEPSIKRGTSGSTIVPINAMENTGSTRNSSITGYCSSDQTITATTTVSQSGGYIAPFISISPNGYHATNDSASTTISVSSNIDWHTITDQRWITISNPSGSGNGNIIVEIAENDAFYDRVAEIVVYNDDYQLSHTFTVRQDEAEKPYITVSPDTIEVPYSGSTENEIRVEANCSYIVTTDVNWITLATSAGTGYGSVSFTTNPNLSNKATIGNIDFTNGDIVRTVSVVRYKHQDSDDV